MPKPRQYLMKLCRNQVLMTELSEMTTYKVCFPDGSQVTTLPGTKEAFTLEKYIEELRKDLSTNYFVLMRIRRCFGL